MDRTRRIAFILGSMKRGGAERVVSILSNHYSRKGWKVDILLLLSNECEYNLEQNIRIIPLANEGNTRIRQIPKWLYGIRSYLRKYKPDTVLSFAARINIIASIANIGIKNNFVVSERNDPLLDGRSIFVRILTNLIYPFTDKVIFQTKKAQSYFNRRTIENSVVIYNPVEVGDRATYVASKKIVAVGRLEEQKNHKLLISAFKNIHTLFPEYKLYIYGEGTLRQSLEEMIIKLGLRDAVLLPGNIRDVHKKMSDAEMFVLSSNYEGLSNALLEAMMMGLPCISTNCLGSNEIIIDGENGLLVPLNDVNELTSAMKRLILKRNFAIMLGKKAKHTSEKFKSTNVIKEWEQVLEK